MSKTFCSVCIADLCAHATGAMLDLRAQVATLTKERDDLAVDLRDQANASETQRARADAAGAACEGLREALEMARDWIDEGPGDPERVAVERAAVDAALAAAPVKRQVKP